MPNNTANRLTVSGPADDIQQFIQKGDEFAFHSFVPMPDEIRHTSLPIRIQTQKEIDAIWDDFNRRKENNQLTLMEKHNNNLPFVGMTQEHQHYLLKTYGCDNWRDWAYKNWGTKWDCYNVGAWEMKENSANIYYETAWTEARPALLTISTQYPNLTFFHEFADEGGGFLGNETIQNGNILSFQDMEWESDEGVKLLKSFERYYYEKEPASDSNA